MAHPAQIYALDREGGDVGAISVPLASDQKDECAGGLAKERRGSTRRWLLADGERLASASASASCVRLVKRTHSYIYLLDGRYLASFRLPHSAHHCRRRDTCVTAINPVVNRVPAPRTLASPVLEGHIFESYASASSLSQR